MPINPIPNFPTTRGNQQLQKELLDCLRKRGPLTRDELIAIFNKPRATLYDNLDILMEANLVKKYELPRNTRGRPFKCFKAVELE